MRGPIARQSVANRKSYASIQDSPLAKFSGRVSDGDCRLVNMLVYNSLLWKMVTFNR